MANIVDLLNTTVTSTPREIIEPVNIANVFQDQIRRFFPEEHFNLTPQSLLYKILISLIGDAGVGSIQKQSFFVRLTDTLFTSSFHDLDRIFGNALSLPRRKDEFYSFDPENHLLTQEEWAEVRIKDAWYKARCLDYMKAISLGTTPAGMALLAKAATGIECDIYERWQYLDDQNSDQIIGVPNKGKTESRNEFVIIPRTADLTPDDEYSIVKLIQRLKPADTIFSVENTVNSRIEVPIDNIYSSSKYFQVKRMVTGQRGVEFPPVDPDTGHWIERDVEKEAPTLAFRQTSETITYASIERASASSFHVGNFNRTQRAFFSHLNNIPNNTYQFNATEAFTNDFVNLTITAPWVNHKDDLFVNNYFPLDYIRENAAPSKVFWASEEADAPASEQLTFILTAERSINLVQFEASTKPYTIAIEYRDQNGAWQPVDLLDNIDHKSELFFIPGAFAWEAVEFQFETVKTQGIRVTFTRKTTPFPYSFTEPFPWSIEVRNLRIAHIINNIDEFGGDPDPNDGSILIEPGGTDILGNAYRSILETNAYAASQAIDGSLTTYWQSQANPSKFAVEALYLDLRDNDGNSAVFDEVFIDPLTPGCLMHFYYTNEETDSTDPEDLDNLLWTPIPRHYILARGIHSLRKVIEAKFLKIEFTKLIPIPYELPDANFAPVQYRLFPTWVSEYINAVKDLPEVLSVFDSPRENSVDLSYTNLGIINPDFTKLKPEAPVGTQDFIEESEESIFDDGTTSKDAGTIKVYPNTLFNVDLVTTLDQSSFINRYLQNQDGQIEESTFLPEAPLAPKPVALVASRNDRLDVAEEKVTPDFWFSIMCRHGYKVVEAKREFKTAYIVGIREVAVYRRDQTALEDQEFYTETFVDDQNVTTNTFELRDWHYAVSLNLTSNYHSLTGDYNFRSF